MTRLKFFCLIPAGIIPVIIFSFTPGQIDAAIITQWSFTATSPKGTTNNSPAPSTGTGIANSLGMTNGYTFSDPTDTGMNTGTGSFTSDDVTSATGVANTGFTEDVWRVRGASGAGSTSTGPKSKTGLADINGWNTAAPQYSQGAEFDVSTVGFQNITVSFDWYATTQGVRDMQEQYTIDGSTWTNINPLQVAVSDDFFGTSTPTNSIDLSAIPGANDNPNFGIRLVSDFDPTYTGAGAPTYTSAALVGGSPVVYNNNSGNWEFGNITFSGDSTAVPEPSTALLLFLGVASLIGCVHRKC